MTLPPTTSIFTTGSDSAFKSVPPATTAPASAGSSLVAPGGLKIPADQRANVALARQLINHQKYLCYQLPRYHQCGHPVDRGGQAAYDLLLSRQHIDRLGYGVECDAECAVDSSRRIVDPGRCPQCIPVEECFSAVLKHSCGHLAGVLSSGGLNHDARLGAHEPCNAQCHSMQIDQNVGGACPRCTSRHCRMIWESYRCGHRGGAISPLVIGWNHLRNLENSAAPCDARCRFAHQKIEVGARCLRCKPLYVSAYERTIRTRRW